MKNQPESAIMYGNMQKEFYASGFLYHPSTDQILLQEITNEKNETSLSLFTGKSKEGEDEKSLFQRIIKDTLGITVPLTAIHAIYDYEHDKFEGDNFISFAEIDDAQAKSISIKAVQWCPLKKLPKLKIATQSRQDIIVGQRVINLMERERMEKELQDEA